MVENAKGENEDVEVLRQVFPFGIIEQIDKHLSGNFEFVANPPYRRNAPGLVIFKFFAETLDMYIHSSCVSDIFISPDVVEELFSGKYLIR